MSRKRWTPEQDAIAMDPALTRAQAAARLGRTIASIEARRHKLRATGAYDASRVNLPAGRAHWLIAKTCLICGLLLPREAFARRKPQRGGPWSSECYECMARQARERIAAAQGRTRSIAVSRGKIWTGVEDDLVMRDDLTMEELAVLLERTYAAVVGRRRNVRRRLARLHPQRHQQSPPTQA